MSPPNESVIRNLMTCLDTAFRRNIPTCKLRSKVPQSMPNRAERLSPEFRTRFHRKTWNGVLELGRVGVSARTRKLPSARDAPVKRAFITRCNKRVNRRSSGQRPAACAQ